MIDNMLRENAATHPYFRKKFVQWTLSSILTNTTNASRSTGISLNYKTFGAVVFSGLEYTLQSWSKTMKLSLIINFDTKY